MWARHTVQAQMSERPIVRTLQDAAVTETEAQAGTQSRVARVGSPGRVGLWQWLVATVAPVVLGALLWSLPLLPSDFRNSPPGGMAEFSLWVLWPPLLCLFLGVFVRSRRVALASGAWVGFFLYAAGRGSVLRDTFVSDIAPLHAVTIFLIVGAAFAGFAAMVARATRETQGK